MHPILIKLGPLTIYSYGVMVAFGFGLATLLIYTRASRLILNRDKIIDLTIIILLSGIIGARLLYVALNLEFYIAKPIEILILAKGGLIWYGGFLSALFASIFYIRKNRLNFWPISDLAAPYIALAQGIGRIGCFLNGCCYGIDGHPTQLYSSLTLLLIFAILRIRQERRHFDGEIFLGYCILYPLKRFLVEFLRGDNLRVVFGLTLSQIISVLIFLVSLAAFAYKAREWRKRYLNSK